MKKYFYVRLSPTSPKCVNIQFVVINSILKESDHMGRGRDHKSGKEKFVLLDLGDKFAAGKVIRTNPYSITLEIYRTGHNYRPAYSRYTIERILPISRATAEYLGHFSYPYSVKVVL